MFLLCGESVMADVAIDLTNFPDENFRNYLLGQPYGSDAILTADEISSITSLDVSVKGISSLTGIGHLTSLTSLDCSRNSLTTLDLSGCAALNKLTCHRNKLSGDNMTALINSLPVLSGGGYLRVVDSDADWNVMSTSQVQAAIQKGWTPQCFSYSEWFEYDGIDGLIINSANFPDANFREQLKTIYYGYGDDAVFTDEEISQIDRLEIPSKGISSLQGIGFLTYLTELNCSGNKLGSLDLSGLDNLRLLNCKNNKLTSLDLTSLVNLESVNCDFNTNLTTLLVSNLPALEILSCEQTNLTSLDLSGCVKLDLIKTHQSHISTLTLGSNQGYLYVDSETLTVNTTSEVSQLRLSSECKKIILGNCPNLEQASLDTRLDELSITAGTPHLGKLVCRSLGLQTLDLSNVTSLTFLDAGLNKLDAVTFSGCTQLVELYLDNNLLATPDFTPFTALNILDIHNNPLTSVTLGSNPSKVFLSHSSQVDNDGSITINGTSNVTKLNIQAGHKKLLFNSPNLAELSISGALEELDISGHTQLSALQCNNIHLLTLKANGCTALETLDVSKNSLETLALNGCSGLTRLTANENQLTSIDLNGCSALEYLNVAANLLTSAPVGSAPALTHLIITNNPLGNLLDTGACPALKTIEAEENNITRLILGSTPEKLLLATHPANSTSTLTVSGNNAFTGLTLESDYQNVTLGTCPALATMTITGKLPQLNATGAGALTHINASDVQLTDINLTGCTALVSLNVSNNGLSTLNAGDCARLTSINARNNRITALTLGNNPESLLLSASSNADATLTVSGTAGLTELTFTSDYRKIVVGNDATALKSLNVSGSLKEVDLSGNTVIANVTCSGSGLETASLNGCTSLATLNVSDNKLSALDISGCAALTTLDCHKNLFTALTVTGCGALTYIDCSQNSIGALGMEDFINSLPNVDNGFLGVVDAQNENNLILEQQVTKAAAKGWLANRKDNEQWAAYTGTVGYWINATNFPDRNLRGSLLATAWGGDQVLTQAEAQTVRLLDLQNLGISDLRGIKYFTELDELHCENNEIMSLDLSANTKLRELWCSGNNLYSLDLSANTFLSHLNCTKNYISQLTLPASLTILQCSDNQLYQLDVSNCRQLTSIECSRNLFSSMDISHNSELISFECQENSNLSSLTIGEHEKLTVINVYGLDQYGARVGQLTSLDVSKCPALQTLNCSGHNLSSIDVTQNPELYRLHCDYNYNVISLDLSKNTKLQDLVCYSMGLYELDLSNNPALHTLRCNYNYLTELDLSANPLLSRDFYQGSVYGPQRRLVRAETAKDKQGNILYYLRLDDNKASNDMPLRDRMTRSSKTRVPSKFNPEKASNWRGGTVFQGSKSAPAGLRKATIGVDDVNADYVTGKILILDPPTRVDPNDNSVEGDVYYNYDVQWSSDLMSDPKEDFWLVWYAWDSIITSVTDVAPNRGEVVSVTYHNLSGQTSNIPFSGVNIVVTRYSDGSTTTKKILR